jgi:hypothetical protein
MSVHFATMLSGTTLEPVLGRPCAWNQTARAVAFAAKQMAEDVAARLKVSS